MRCVLLWFDDSKRLRCRPSSSGRPLRCHADVAIDGGEEAPFEHAEDFVARGMAFPVIGVNRMVVVEGDNPKSAVVFDCSTPINQLGNTRGSPVGNI
jgi:hypothetical protein